MSPEPPHPRAPRGTRGPRALQWTDGDPAGDQLENAYLNRAIREMAALQHEIATCPRCHPTDSLPVEASGSPRAEIFLVKWAPTLAERQERVAFFGRSGAAVLKSVQRLGIDPLALYGTLCIKCTHLDPDEAARLCPAWLAHELQIVTPKLVVAMGPRVLAALNGLGFPMSEPLAEEPGVIQRWTPTVEALLVPDIDESLDEQGAKRRFWEAFRVIGDWHHAQPPY
jgi:uracil-DNA glycosylase family 4